jgi:hypothetical protein
MDEVDLIDGWLRAEYGWMYEEEMIDGWVRAE